MAPLPLLRACNITSAEIVGRLGTPYLLFPARRPRPAGKTPPGSLLDKINIDPEFSLGRQTMSRWASILPIILSSESNTNAERTPRTRRRREEADLQKALHLSTQGSHHPSSVFLSSSSPIQIPSGFRLAFQSESTQGSVVNPQFSDPLPKDTSIHHGTGSGSGSASGTSADPSTFQGFQGGIFAGLQTPLVGIERDRSTSILSPTMMATGRTGPGVAPSRSNGGARERRVLDDDDVVAGSEDDETEEEEPFEALHRSAQKARSEFHIITCSDGERSLIVRNHLVELPLAAAKPMSPLPIPPSETIESFPASSSSHHPKPSHPPHQPGVPARYVSSPIEGFTTSNSNDRASKGSSSTDPSRDAQRAQIVLSAPTEHARPRPQPRQRRRVDEGETRLFDPDGLNGSPVAGPSNTSNDASGSPSRPAENSSGPGRAASPGGISPPLIKKPVVVYAKRSIHSKKRKIMLSDSEAEDADPPVTLDQALAGSVTPVADQPEKESGRPESKRKNQSEGEDRPSKKSRGRDDATRTDTRDERETSIDPLDLGHVDPDRTPLKSRMVVEIDSAKRAGKELQPNKDHDGDDDDDDEVIIISSNLPKAKSKSKRRVQDDDDDGDPFEGLAPDAAMADTDEEDDFVPSGKKRKPPAKAKKAPAKKEKRPPTGKKGSTATATPVPATAATVSTVDGTAEQEAVPMQLDAPSTAATTTSAQTEVPKAVEPASKKGAKAGKNGKGKDAPASKPASIPTQSTSAESKKKEKSAEFINSDEEDDVVPSAKKSAAKSTAGSEKAGVGASGPKSKNKDKPVASDVEVEVEEALTGDVSLLALRYR